MQQMHRRCISSKSSQATDNSSITTDVWNEPRGLNLNTNDTIFHLTFSLWSWTTENLDLLLFLSQKTLACYRKYHLPVREGDSWESEDVQWQRWIDHGGSENQRRKKQVTIQDKNIIRIEEKQFNSNRPMFKGNSQWALAVSQFVDQWYDQHYHTCL